MVEAGSMTFGIIGLGHIGSAIAGALRNHAAAQVVGTKRGDDNVALVRTSDVVVLAVKPREARAVVEAIAGELRGKLLVSVCAGITIADLRAWSKDAPAIVRAMPNLPGLIGAGMTVLAADHATSPEQLGAAINLFGTMGRTAVLDEALLDAVTGLSGCGPGYAFLIIDALAAAGTQLGIDTPTATLLAAQTLLGAAQMVLEGGVAPAALKDQVATPGGCTVEGLAVLEQRDVRNALVDAVTAATQRSVALRGG
jgi:pyrroline-5-carboxylate reductase